MTQENDPKAPAEANTWIASAIEGGLPQVIAGPAGKAISRLIGAAVEIPAAYVEGISQGIRDQTKARTTLTEALAERLAQQVVEDPAVMERAVNSMLHRQYRVQQNKDRVAKVAVEDLLQSPPSPGSSGPPDDWMDRFERLAEDAGNADLQFLFGRILAGEVRKPGSIGVSTLHMASMLDAETASLINRVLPYSLPEGVTLLGAMPSKLSDAEVSYVEQSGFFSSGKFYRWKLNEKGEGIVMLGHNEYAAVWGAANTEYGVGHAAILSAAGKGLLQALQPKFDIQSYCEQLIKLPNVKSIAFGKGVQSKGGVAIPQPEWVHNPKYVAPKG